MTDQYDDLLTALECTLDAVGDIMEMLDADEVNQTDVTTLAVTFSKIVVMLSKAKKMTKAKDAKLDAELAKLQREYRIEVENNIKVDDRRVLPVTESTAVDTTADKPAPFTYVDMYKHLARKARERDAAQQAEIASRRSARPAGGRGLISPTVEKLLKFEGINADTIDFDY